MKKMFLILAGVSVFLGLVAYYYKNQAIEQERLKNIYLGNNQLLLTRIKKVYDDKVATDRKIRELEQRAKEDLAFDWGVDISSSPVILELKK
jgi:hypothetical protein